MVQPRTSAPTICSRGAAAGGLAPIDRRIGRAVGGFTLIEMMVVVAIIALISALAIPSITSYFQVSLTSASREMASTIKEAYNSTIITGKVHRLVYDLKESQYWVESGPTTLLLDTKESKDKEEHRSRLGTRKKAGASAGGLPFALEKGVTRKKIDLPTGVKFEDILTQQFPEPVTEGAAYTHFFPHGIIEQTIVHLQDKSNHHVSLIISPIVGRTDMYEHYVNAEEAFGKK